MRTETEGCQFFRSRATFRHSSDNGFSALPPAASTPADDQVLRFVAFQALDPEAGQEFLRRRGRIETAGGQILLQERPQVLIQPAKGNRRPRRFRVQENLGEPDQLQRLSEGGRRV